MKGSIMKTILSTLFTVIFATALFSQSAEEAVNLLEDHDGFGIRAAGMGNAYSGVADDYSAIYWNPAGLGLIKQTEFSIGFYNKVFNSSVIYENNLTESDRSYSGLQHIGMAYSFPTTQGSLTLAFGYQRIKSLENYKKYTADIHRSNGWYWGIENDFGYYELPFDTLRQEKQSLANEGNLSQWSIGASMEFSKNFYAGITLNFYGGDNEYKQDYSQDDIDDANSFFIVDQDGNTIQEFYYNYYDAHYKIKSDYSGFEAKLGALYNLGDFIKLGGTVTFPMSLKIREDWSSDDVLLYDIYNYDDGLLYEYESRESLGEGIFEYIIKTPYKFSAGASAKLLFLTVAGSAEYVDWSQTKYEIPDNADERDYQDLLDQNDRFREDFRPTVNISIGAEADFFNRVALRAGLRYLPSPLKDMDTKYDKKYLSAGLGFNFNNSATFNISYTVGIWETDKYYDYVWQPDNYYMQTSEEYFTQKIMAGLSVKF